MDGNSSTYLLAFDDVSECHANLVAVIGQGLNLDVCGQLRQTAYLETHPRDDNIHRNA